MTSILQRDSSTDWPTRTEVLVCAAVAAACTFVDLLFSQEAGLAAYPLFYDGAGWVLDAKQSLHRFGASLDPGGRDVMSFGQTADALLSSRTPGWQLLLIVQWLLLGEGELQAYSVRFWPLFLIFLAVVWVARRRGSTRIAWVVLALCAAIPTLAVGLRALASEALSGTFFWGQQWYLADLRPDLLAAALLLWAVLVLIEHASVLPRSAFVVSAIFAVGAVLIKPSTSPLALATLGVTGLYLAALHRQELGTVVRRVAVGVAVGAALLLPWSLAGGLRTLGAFLRSSFTVQRDFYSNPDATLFSEISYYLRLLPIHMGWEGTALIVLAGILFLARQRIRRTLPGGGLYLGLGVFLFAAVVTTPNKNPFLGLPSYLFLLVFGVVVVAAALNSRSTRFAAFGVGLWLLVVTALAVSSYSTLSPEWHRRGADDKAAVSLIVDALSSHVDEDEDCFAHLPLYGAPSMLQFHMVDDDGDYPHSPFPAEDVEESPPSAYLDQVRACDAVVAFEEPLEEEVSSLPDVRKAYFEVIRRWASTEPSFDVILETEVWGNRAFDLDETDRVAVLVLVRDGVTTTDN